MIINPTQGRVLEFHPSELLKANMGLTVISELQPMAAIVTYVWHPRLVNVEVFDHGGKHHAVNSVALLQEADMPMTSETYCRWPARQAG